MIADSCAFKEELLRVRNKGAAVERTFGLLVCAAFACGGLIFAPVIVPKVVFLAGFGGFMVWAWTVRSKMEPLAKTASRLRSLLEMTADQETRIQSRCPEDQIVDSSIWKEPMSYSRSTCWKDGEEMSLQPGDVVLAFEFCPNGVTTHYRRKLERRGKIVAQWDASFTLYLNPEDKRD